MTIKYLKKASKTASTDDTKTKDIVPVSYTHLRAHET